MEKLPVKNVKEVCEGISRKHKGFTERLKRVLGV